MISFDKETARAHGVGIALIISYLKQSKGKMDVSDLRKFMKIPYSKALAYLLKATEKGLLVGVGDQNPSLWYSKYTVSPSLKSGGEAISRK